MVRVPQVHNTQNGVTGGVWREGDVIVKRLRSTAPDAVAHWQPSSDPRSFRYWRRELDAYQSALPQRLGLVGPELLGAVDTADGAEFTVAAFVGRTRSELTVDDLAELALQVGRSQGRAEQPVDPWLSRSYLRDYSSRDIADHRLYARDDLWQQELVAPYADEDLRAGLEALHANRERLLAISESLPRAVCHLDLFPANVFATETGLGIIDWSFSGDGAIGEDIGNLIPDSVFDLDLQVSLLPELEERLIDAYLVGLRAAGWRGDDRLAVLGVHASAVKYDWLGPRVLDHAGQPAHAGYGGEATVAHELYAARWEGLRLIARWASDALAEAEKLLRP